MRMYWRIFGPAWTPSEIDYQLGLLKEAGVGGVTAYFMYPVALDDPALGIHNQKYLSEEFLNTFRYAAGKAKELGLRFGVNGGTGWPFGGPWVSGDDAAQRIRVGKIGEKLGEGEKLIARDGDSQFITGPTRMGVKRPAYGSEGPVLDHYSRDAAIMYLDKAVKPLVDAAPGLVEAIGCDSLEVYASNWTDAFPSYFRQSRGSDITSHLAGLFDGDKDLRFDFWRTLAEMTEEQFTKTVGEWSKKHHVKLEMEAYGMPPNPMTAARYIDEPTGEHYEWKGYHPSRYMASAAHLCGKRIIGAEAWTWSGIPNRLGDTLSDLKLLSDFHFLGGVNDLTGVDFPYSPRSAGAPGWQPYYGPTMNQNNPQWPVFHYFVDYINRCQWMLRQGKPTATVAVYLPVEDCLAKGPMDGMLLDFALRDSLVTGKPTSEFGLGNALRHHSNLIHNLITQGFDFDGIDFWAMNRIAKVHGGKLVAGDGHYSTIILFNLTGMDLAAMEKLERFCHSGGTVIAVKRFPDRVYGFGRGSDSRKLQELVKRMFSQERYGKGRAILVPDDGESLIKALATLTPDVRMEPYQPEVEFVHRRAGDRDIYFLVNASDKPTAFHATFATKKSEASIWDPIAGDIVAAHGPSIAIQLPARGSIFVVFGVRTKTQAKEPPNEAIPLSGPWHLSFTGPDAPAPYDPPSPAYWKDKYFSGQGTYATTVQWEGPLPNRAILRLSDVREVAEVRMNGKAAGAAWCPPFEVDITSLLRHGPNTIEITVGNLPLNRFLGLPDQDLGAMRKVYGNRFPAPEEKSLFKEPPQAGLGGPVALAIRR